MASAPVGLGIFVEADRAMVLEIGEASREPTVDELAAFNFVGTEMQERPVAMHRLVARALQLSDAGLESIGSAVPRIVERNRIVFDVVAMGLGFEIVLAADLSWEHRSSNAEHAFADAGLAYDLAMAHLLSHRDELRASGFDFSAVDAEPPWPLATSP